MEDELDLNLSPVHKPKQGRRAGAAGAAGAGAGNAFGEDSAGGGGGGGGDVLFGSPLRGRPQTTDELFLDDAPPRRGAGPPQRGRRRQGGWGDDSGGGGGGGRTKTAKSVRIQSAAKRFGPGSDDEDEDGIIDDDDGEIPIIPDLDDVQEEDLALQVAEAPSVAVNRVATYRELDSDLLRHVAFATLDDIDLRLLTHCLAPEATVREADEQWTWDEAFAEVSGQLQKEWFPEEEQEEKKAAAKERPYTAFNRFAV